MEDMFKRMNFFKGFFTQAEDWQQGQDYHIEKRHFHNRFFHTPGIVFGCLDNLKVTVAKDGTTLYIAAGYAADGQGRDLFLPKQERIPFSPQSYHPPTTVYIVIQYQEEKVDLRPNAANPEHSDYAFIQETPLVEITTTEPDNHHAVELARISLSKDVSRVRDAKDPTAPGANEIDMTYVKRAGVVTGPFRLADTGSPVKEGEITVIGHKEPMPQEDDTNVLIEKVKSKDPHRFYQVSAYPEEDARITWRMESSCKNNEVEYRIYFKNFSKQSVKVFYKVYRLH